jgi:hypothetical protein
VPQYWAVSEYGRRNSMVWLHCLACVYLLSSSYPTEVPMPTSFLDCSGNWWADEKNGSRPWTFWSLHCGGHAHKRRRGGLVSYTVSDSVSVQLWPVVLLWSNKWAENWFQSHKWLQMVGQQLRPVLIIAAKWKQSWRLSDWRMFPKWVNILNRCIYMS